MKITRKPTYSEEKLRDGKVRVSYSVQVDGVEYKREIISRNSDSARKIARDAVTEQVKQRNPEQASQIGNNIENYSGAGLASRETPEESRFRESNVTAPAEEHMDFEGANIEGNGTVRPSDMEGYNPEMEDQFYSDGLDSDKVYEEYEYEEPADNSDSGRTPVYTGREEYEEEKLYLDLDGNLEAVGGVARAEAYKAMQASANSESGGSQGNVETSQGTNKAEQRQFADAPRENPPRKNEHQRSKRQKNHVPWGTTLFGTDLDGTGDRELSEPNPEYFVRPGEKIIAGDNNTCIVLGRDRGPSTTHVFSRNVDKRKYTSGFSDYMCAGAIDIVVGRMAPFPVNKIGAVEDFVTAPCFNTTRPPALQGLQLNNGQHPGLMMDSARIYISQMTIVDENFKIKQDVSTSWIDGTVAPDPNVTRSDRRKVIPTSAIMLKADKVRMHSRQDLKIVTGGPFEEFNSMGNSCQNNGIHLIAENGIAKDGYVLPQHPMVLGHNLVKCLFEVNGLIEDCVQTVDHAMSVQMAFNQVMASNFDLLPLPSGTTVPNPYKTISGMVAALEHLVKTRFGSLLQLVNNFRTKSGYLSASGDDQHWILSRYNTVN